MLDTLEQEFGGVDAYLPRHSAAVASCNRQVARRMYAADLPGILPALLEREGPR